MRLVIDTNVIISLEAILDLVTLRAKILHAPPLKEKVCSDSDDDKFLACAIASSAKIICGGDAWLARNAAPLTAPT